VNILQEEKGTLNSVLRIQVSKEDYSDKVDRSLAQLAKKVQLKGFRPGKVPKGMVRKLYGNQVLAEELDKLVREEMSKYLQEKDIRILGQPLPDDSVVIDSAEPKDYEFRYELGLSPKVPLDVLSKNTSLPKAKVEVTDVMVNKEWERLLRDRGSLEPVEEVEAGDLIHGKFVELDASGEIKPGGIFHESVINQDMVKDPGLSQELIGAVKGDTVVFEDLAKALDRSKESVLSGMLGAREADPAQVGDAFRLEITEIKRNKPAEATEAFLKQTFGNDEVKDADAARDIIRQEMAKAYDQHAERLLNDDIVRHFLDTIEVPMPDDFLKRWLEKERQQEAAKATEEGKDPEPVEPMGEAEFDSFRRKLKWSLIYNEIAREKELTVSKEELEEAVRAEVRRHYGPAFESLADEDINGLVGRLLGDREYLEKVHGNLLDVKVFRSIQEHITTTEEAMDLETFEERMAKAQAEL
jgi:trigger factor